MKGKATIMSTDTPEFWNGIWADIEDCGSGSDQILADQIEGLTPRRAMDIGCGTGSNAIWLAKQGWQVTAVDHSQVAMDKGKRLAAEQGVNIEFVLAAASTYQPQGHYDLITFFYILMFPMHRAIMLATMSKALTPGGTLLFVSHDKSGPPSGWSEEDLSSLTTPVEIVAELAEGAQRSFQATVQIVFEGGRDPGVGPIRIFYGQQTLQLHATGAVIAYEGLTGAQILGIGGVRVVADMIEGTLRGRGLFRFHGSSSKVVKGPPRAFVGERGWVIVPVFAVGSKLGDHRSSRPAGV